MKETGKQLKCPNCGGPLEFDPVSQKMKCSYCDTLVDVKESEGTDEEKAAVFQGAEKTTRENAENTGEDTTGEMRVITCKNCGAELVTDEFTTASFCTYCGSPSIVESRVTGEKMPDFVIPFQIDKKKALEEYRKWTKKGLLTPNVFRSEAVMEKITGIYVPFWLYDYNADLHAEGECVRTRFTSDSQNDYTHRDYFYVCRDIEARFEKVPADASEKMEDSMMDKLEPFDYEKLKPFKMDYLSGYLSERYNMAAAALEERVGGRVEEYMEEILAGEVSGYSEKHLKKNVQDQVAKEYYALLPVWLLNYRYRGKVYSFAMNGQSGKIVADLPVSAIKTAGVFLVSFVVMYLITMIIGGLIL
ncbi:MAG: hypothetical protein Q4B70_12645 [Lachnospiraceae bacterium]|nr:hypothetical protein [Lachnospiraceae bacterium]